MKKTAGVLALCLTAAVAQAQPAYRVKDVNPQTGRGTLPRDFVAVGGAVYFGAEDEANGREIWRTDGTASGTHILKDVVPGPAWSFPANIVDLHGTLFFTNGGGLWRSNGTSAGTHPVRPDLDSPDHLAVAGDWLYFSAVDADHGRELWRTDGTDAGTTLVKDIQPGPEGSGPQPLVALGGLVFFPASGPAGRELWRSDGSVEGTIQVLDIAPGIGSSRPEQLSAVGTSLYFTAADPAHGREPWTTSLTSGVTSLVRDIRPGGESSNAGSFVDWDGVAYFHASDGVSGDELWRSDGTLAGTTRVMDLVPGPNSSQPTQMTALGASLFFIASNAQGIVEMWRTDGTAAGTLRVDAVDPYPFGLIAFAGAVYYTAFDFEHGRELWRTDGTAAGTERLDLLPGTPGSWPDSLAVAGGRLYFGAVPPGVLDKELHGGEPWVSDGTAAGSVPLSPFSWGAGSQITSGAALGNVFFFGADDGVHGQELWRSDGTDAGTFLVKDLVPGSDKGSPSDFVAMGGILYFQAYVDEVHRGLWRTDGTAAGTARLSGSGPALLDAYEIRRVGSTLFFAGRDASSGYELWKSDGTEAGTVRVREINPGPSSSVPRELTDVNGTLFFSAYDPIEGRELWKSDGTAAGTVRVEAIAPGPASSGPTALAAGGSILYFRANDGLHGFEPWRSDGSDPGTQQIRDVWPGPVGSGESPMATLGAVAFFTANDGTTGDELWQTDGSEAGTVRVADIRPGAASGLPLRITPVGNAVLFSADDGATGRELWKSDGTAAGTLRLGDLAPGPESALAVEQSLTEWGGFAFFPAHVPLHGQELWRSDGTAEGTTLLQDIVPGPSSSGLALFSSAGGRLFLRAADAAGAELWALRPELTVANATAPEGTHALVDVTLVPRLDVPLAVPFATADHSAVGGSDFQAKSGVLTFAPGETLQTVEVAVLDDATTEPVEQFFVDVAPAANAFASRPRGVVTVTDDDLPPTLTIDDVAVVEGDTSTVDASFTIRLATASATALVVGYATGTGTATPQDFEHVSGTITFPPGTTSRTVNVPVFGDRLDEPDEFFHLALSPPPGAVVASGEGVARIADDDGASGTVTALDWGMDLTATLATAPGPQPDSDLYLVRFEPGSSYEITVDAASGDLGFEGPIVELLDEYLVVVRPSSPLGVGHARVLRLRHDGAGPFYYYVRVRSAGCALDCGVDDSYRIRLRDTTGRVPRFNQAGGQKTALILQNRSDETIGARAVYWRADGQQLGSAAAVLPPHGVALLQAPAGASGASGSITVSHGGGHGDLAGKAVQFDEATGLTFDTPLETRPR